MHIPELSVRITYLTTLIQLNDFKSWTKTMAPQNSKYDSAASAFVLREQKGRFRDIIVSKGSEIRWQIHHVDQILEILCCTLESPSAVRKDMIGNEFLRISLRLSYSCAATFLTELFPSFPPTFYIIPKRCGTECLAINTIKRLSTLHNLLMETIIDLDKENKHLVNESEKMVKTRNVAAL